MSIFRPEIFQGNLTSKQYFEGWYFKHVSAQIDVVYSFIPGISLNVEHPHAFIQIINGITGETQYIEYPLSDFSYSKDAFKVQIGESVFTRDYISLRIDAPSIKVEGHLVYTNIIKYPRSLLSPGIMGWYSFVPFMECKHGIVSVSHRIDGSLTIDNQLIDFSGGKGYIEKDWGKSFPESWIWLHSNNFTHSDACIMISIAKIPWLGSSFVGFISFLYCNGKFYHFSTYNGAKIRELKYAEDQLKIELINSNYSLSVKASIKKSGILKAPVRGKMDRHIKESVDSEIVVVMKDKKGNVIYEDTAVRTGLEVIEEIFEIKK